MTEHETRIVVADDHTLVRRGLRLILDAEEGLRVVAEVGDGAAAVACCLSEEVDLAVLDIAMPRMTGLQAAREITRSAPHVRVLLLSMYDNEQYFLDGLAAGASGYVLKSVADRDLVQACRSAVRGVPFVYPAADNGFVREYFRRERSGERLPVRVLTQREEEVTKLIAEGLSSKDIAELLVISIKTVERHRENILAKLDLRNRLELTRYAIRTGLVEP